MAYTTSAQRRIRVNTVKFDVQAVILYYMDGANFILCGAAFKKSDLDNWLIPHQMEALSKLTLSRMCYLSVVPYGSFYNPPDASMEIDPNLTETKDPEELSPGHRLYKHHTRTMPYSEMCFTVPVGSDFAALGGLDFFSQPTGTSYQYDWFPQGALPQNAIEEMVIIPLPDINAGDVDYYTGIEYTVNLGIAVPDWAMRNAIYSNYQVIRGNEYGTREHLIDTTLPTGE